MCLSLIYCLMECTIEDNQNIFAYLIYTYLAFDWMQKRYVIHVWHYYLVYSAPGVFHDHIITCFLVGTQTFLTLYISCLIWLCTVHIICGHTAPTNGSSTFRSLLSAVDEHETSVFDTMTFIDNV